MKGHNDHLDPDLHLTEVEIPAPITNEARMSGTITDRIVAIRERLEALNAEFDVLQAEIAARDVAIKREVLGLALVAAPRLIDLNDRVQGDEGI